jgi:hypothetical protein
VQIQRNAHASNAMGRVTASTTLPRLDRCCQRKSLICWHPFQQLLLALRMLALSCQPAAMDILGCFSIHFMWHEERMTAEVACGYYELASVS